MTYGEGCATCLQDQEGGVIIGNFADTTYNACQKQPYAENGDLVETSRDLFDTDRIDSAASTSVSATTGTTATTSSSTGYSTGGKAPVVGGGTASLANSDTKSQSTSLSSGDAAGIGIGVAIAVLAIVGGVFLWVRRKKQKASDQIMLETPPGNAQELPYNMGPQEISGKEKPRFHVPELEVKSVPAQELDGTSARR